MNLKTITSVAALALAATCYVTPASAVPVSCKVDTNNHMLVDSVYVQSCIDAGVGNIGNGQNDDFLNAGNTGWTDITSQAPTYGFSQTQSPGSNTGSFFFNPALWDSFDEIAIGFKFGTGNQPDEWFVYVLQQLTCPRAVGLRERVRQGRWPVARHVLRRRGHDDGAGARRRCACSVSACWASASRVARRRRSRRFRTVAEARNPP